MKNKGDVNDKARNFLKQDLFLNTLPFMILCLTDKMKISFCNDAYAQFVGKKSSRLIGKKLLDLFPEFKKTKSYQAYREVLSSGVPQEVEGKFKDRYMHSWIYRMSWGILAVAYDVTARRVAQDELQQRETIDSALFEYSPIQTIVVDREARVIKFNKAKRDSGDRLPKVGDVMYKDYASRHETDMHAELMECIKSGKTKTFPEQKYDDKILAITLAPFPEGAVITMQDITESIKAQRELEKSEETYRTLVQTSPEAVTTTDLEGNITYVSKQTLEMHGYEKENELLGKSAFELIAPEERQKAMDNMQDTLKEGRLYNVEYNFIKKDGTRFPAELNATVIKDSNGIPYAFIATTRDITERKQAERELKESEAQYRDLVEEAGIAILIDDKDGNFTYFNKKYAEIFGYSEDEMKKQTIKSLVHPDDVKRITDFHKKRMKGKDIPDRYEFKGKKKDGSTIYLEVHVVPLKEGEEIIGTRSYVWDITERRNAENGLRESEEKFSNLFQHSNDAIFINDLDGNILDINNKVLDLLGYERDELQKLKIEDLHPADASEKSKWAFDTISKEGVVSFEIDFKKKDGTTFPAEVSSSLFEIGGTKFIQGFVRDITERKLAEEALQESEEKYRSLVEQTLNGIVIVQDSPLRIVFANRTMCEIMGYTFEELKSLSEKQVANLMPAEDRDAVVRRFRDVMSGAPPEPRSIRVIRKDGQIRWLQIYGRPIEYQESKALQLTIVDMTERKQAEEKFMAIFDCASDAIFIHDLEGSFLEVNKTACERLGYDREDLLNMSPMDIDSQEYAELVPKRLNEIKEEEQLFFETAHVTRDGKVIPIELSSRIIEYEGKPAVLSIARDITERKQSEQALQAEKAYLEQLFDNAQEAIIMAENDGRVIRVNEEFLRLFGYKRDDIIGKPVDSLVTHGEQLDEALSITKEAAEGNTVAMEGMRRRKDGSLIDVSILAAPITVGEKQVGVYGIYRDITDRKKAETALRASEEKYRTLVEQSLQGIVIVQDFRIVFANESFVDISRYTIDELKSLSPDGVKQMVHPDDQELVWGRMRDRLEGKPVPRRYEYRGIKKNGNECWLEMFVQLIEFEGKPAIQGVIVDVTERKQAEEEITRLASFAKQNPSPIIETDLKGTLTYLNPVAQERFPKLTEIGLNHPILDDLVSLIEDFRQGKKEYITREIDIDGAIYEQRICHVRESDLIRIFTFDITDRKRFEKELQQSLDKLEHTIDNTLQAMAKILETRDPYTAGHQLRVASLAIAIADEMNLPDDKKRGLHVAAVIHDMGKIYVPAEILTRPTTLTDSEFELIKTHPKVGADILKTIEFPWPVADIILQHHERVDGSGYPEGLKGKDILIEARILAVADVVEAMSSHRPYRPAKGLEATLEEIAENKGVLYDADVVDACLKVIKDKGFKFD